MDDRRSIVDWDEQEVQQWLSKLGYPQYDAQIKEHRISGDILCMIDSDTLKSIGVQTIGQRLAILKAVYQLKLAQNVPIESDDYVPPSEIQERSENVTIEKLHLTVKDQGQRLRTLEEENRALNNTLQNFLDDYNSLRVSLGLTNPEESPIVRQPSFKWAQFKPSRSPTKAELDSPHPSPQQLEHDVAPYTRGPAGHSQFSSSERARPQPAPSESPNIPPAAPKPIRQESTDNLKSFKVSLEDPTWKVLPAALKKYRINNDNWENYAMFICYGSPGNRIERCLSYDEKPLLLFQKLKDAKKNPVFMLKHIKDIRSPIAVAQQKHAARKANSIMSNESTGTSATVGHAKATRTATRPPKLEVNDLSAAPSLMSGLSPQPGGWPEPGFLSPSVESSRGEETPVSAALQPHILTQLGSSVATPTHDGIKSPEQPLGSSREMPVASSSGVSYAVAIYPYMAEQDDEFDVVVGDTFVIISRARGWWVVQRDPTGSGIVDTDVVKHGWVPAGCLLETNVPVASAIAEATAAKGVVGSSPPDTPDNNKKTPILPLSIISTSFPGIALMDYKKKGDEELDLMKDDALRVFKRYNHWSYAVKEEGGDRGWVPSWFIGKVASGVPPTPSTGVPPSSALDDVNQSQMSPMTAAFPPPVQGRSTTAI
ncbi:hypothetical protein C8J56DRAFT_1007330 [Mycena floridula]|nr:hypothetical protein C8J56DRAFT_1007330 [Mycena floridula]